MHAKSKTRKQLQSIFFCFGGVYNKTVIPIALVGRDDDSQLKSNARVE